MWIDADVMITNQNRKIDDLLDLLLPENFLLIGEDFQGINAGVFIIKNTPLAIEFLNDVWLRDDLSRINFHEQTAISDLRASKKYSHLIQVIPHSHVNLLNAYDSRVDPKTHWIPGDFCLHLAGLNFEDRQFLQTEYSQRIASYESGDEPIKSYKELLKAQALNNGVAHAI